MGPLIPIVTLTLLILAGAALGCLARGTSETCSSREPGG